MSKIVIVDTNCFVRLYFSELRPMLGVEVSGHTLMTIKELANETTGNTGLTVRLPWLANADVQADLNSAILQLAKDEDDQYDDDADYYRTAGDVYLERYCKAKSLSAIRQLSMADAKALAIALDRGYILATDEWPLREFSQVVEPDDEGSRITMMSSLQLLKLFLDDGKMGLDQVRTTVRGWIQNDERLLSGWTNDYRTLFGESPPDAQA